MSPVAIRVGPSCNLTGVLVGRGRDTRMHARREVRPCVKMALSKPSREASQKATLKHRDL